MRLFIVDFLRIEIKKTSDDDGYQIYFPRVWYKGEELSLADNDEQCAVYLHYLDNLISISGQIGVIHTYHSLFDMACAVVGGTNIWEDLSHRFEDDGQREVLAQVNQADLIDLFYFKEDVVQIEKTMKKYSKIFIDLRVSDFAYEKFFKKRNPKSIKPGEYKLPNLNEEKRLEIVRSIDQWCSTYVGFFFMLKDDILIITRITSPSWYYSEEDTIDALGLSIDE